MHWSKLRAEYVEIFHNALDHIQVDTLEDISIVLVNFMHREDNEEFPQIIPDRIAAEINAFNSLNEAQKTQYIQAQQQTRTSVTEITSRTAPAPGSDVLVLSEQQWLAGFQQDLMNESNLELEGLSMMILQENLYFHQVNIANPSNRPISQVVQEPIDQIIITLDQYLQIPIDHREEALRSITINTYRGINIMSQNTCAEEMLTIAARRSGLALIHFNNNPKNDHQIPLNPPLLMPDEHVFSKDRVMFKKLIDRLDKNQSYILRTGKNSGAGHWSLLQFLPNQGWQLYSTSTNNSMLTTQDNTLIEEGVDSLLGNPRGTGKWGNEMDEYAIHIWAATPRRVIDCTNFVCGFRSSPSPDAYECEDAGRKLMEACDGFFVEDHPYVNIARRFAAPPAFTMEKFSNELDTAFFILQQPGGAAQALRIIEDSLKSLANRADGEAVIRGRIGPQFVAAKGDKTILNALDSIIKMCQLPITAQAPISKETTLEELDSLLDHLFHPDNRHQSKTVSEIVIACLMNMSEPSKGTELILKRIEPNIGAAEAEHAEYKATLEEIQEMVQSIQGFRPR